MKKGLTTGLSRALLIMLLFLEACFGTELIFGLNMALNKESAAPQAVHQSSISAVK